MFRCLLQNCESILKHPEYTKYFCPQCTPQTTLNFSEINYFNLYSLPQIYSLNKQDLYNKYKNFQLILHPDILRSKGIHDQNYSKLLQDSYKTLSDDVIRAKYLLHLNNIDSEKIEMQDPSYLEEQFELRSKISESSQSDLKTILFEADSIFKSYQAELETHFAQNDLKKASFITAKLNFTQKIIEETKAKLDFLT